MKLVVGLGNPGRKYVGTRHNVGWEVLGELARKYGGSFPKSRFHGETVDASIEGQAVLLLCPQTYMNKSGDSVGSACDFYKLSRQDLLVVCDDFNLPLAKLRFRTKGSAGGQKGLQDIIRRLGADEVPRLRIGIGAPPSQWDPADFVLGKFSTDEAALMTEAITRAVSAVAVWVRDGADACMNQFNV